MFFMLSKSLSYTPNLEEKPCQEGLLDPVQGGHPQVVVADEPRNRRDDRAEEEEVHADHEEHHVQQLPPTDLNWRMWPQLLTPAQRPN